LFDFYFNFSFLPLYLLLFGFLRIFFTLSKEFLIELKLFVIYTFGWRFSLTLFIFEVVLSHSLDLVPFDSLLVKLSFPKLLVKVIRVSLEVPPNHMLAGRVLHNYI
jgi:hypothetical protein